MADELVPDRDPRKDPLPGDAVLVIYTTRGQTRNVIAVRKDRIRWREDTFNFRSRKSSSCSLKTWRYWARNGIVLRRSDEVKHG